MSDAQQRQRSYWDRLAMIDPDAAVIDPRDKRGLKNSYLAGVRDEVFARTLAMHGIQGGVVLDLGAGTGSAALPLLCAGHRVLGVDISLGLLRHARKRCSVAGGLFAVTNGNDLPIKPNCLDAAVIYGVLCYITDDAVACRLLEQVHASLKSGGVLVMIEQARVCRRPCEDGLKVQRTIEEWTSLLETAGFVSISHRLVRYGRFPTTPLIQLGLIPGIFFGAVGRLESWVGRVFGVVPWDYAEVEFVAMMP